MERKDKLRLPDSTPHLSLSTNSHKSILHREGEEEKQEEAQEETVNVHSEFVRTTQNTNSNSTSLQSSSRPPTSTSPNRIELEAKLEEAFPTPISVAMNISGKVSVAIVAIISHSSSD